MEHCPGLRELDLSGCLGIGNKLLAELQRILLDDENCHRKSSEFTLNIGGKYHNKFNVYSVQFIVLQHMSLKNNKKRFQ